MTTSLRNAGRVLLVLAALATAASADAQPGRQDAKTTAAAPVPRQAQGIAVVASGTARDDAFTLARAVYASSLRPRSLDELRARILAGDPAPPTATRDVRELAELRAGVSGDDAASRRLLAAIAQQLDVQALLVVSRTAGPPLAGRRDGAPVGDDAGSPTTTGGTSATSGASGTSATDAGTSGTDAGAPAATTPSEADGGAAATPVSSHVMARLFLAESGDFDAARYEPDVSGWRGTVTSLSSRFPPPPTPAAAPLQGAPPPKLPSEGKDGKPFYTSPWLWGAVGAAVLIGGFFLFATQDTSDDPIHLQMRVPR